MQTFLPYVEFQKSADVLDYPKRLGKQRVETMQILDLLEGRKTNNWVHHVATRSWQGYEQALRHYGNIIIQKFIDRGGNNNMPFWDVEEIEMPPWVYDERFTLSHRCNLVRKWPEYYSQFGWKNIDPEAPYWWPKPLKDKKKNQIMIDYWGR